MFSLFNTSEAEAAKPDRTAPTAPTSLHVTGVTDSTISIAWNRSTDNIGVTGYDVYQNNKVIGKTTSTQFIVVSKTVIIKNAVTPVPAFYKTIGYFTGWSTYSNYQVANTELNLLHQYVDYIKLMTYDIHGSWDLLTGMNAPLYKDPDSSFYSEWSVQDSVQTYINNGVPANKIIMDVPFYGRIYNQVKNINNGLYQSFAGGGTALSYAALEGSYVNKNGFIRFWEPDSKVPWLFNGSQFISYGDVESIGYKTTYIKTKGLGGAMMWELSQDPNRVLLSKIYNDLR